jgi:hypothetical protein
VTWLSRLHIHSIRQIFAGPLCSNTALFEDFSYVWTNGPPGSTLTVNRVMPIEFTIDLYDLFNTDRFFFLIDTGPKIGNTVLFPNPDALMAMIDIAMSHYGYRTSEIRAGFDVWRDVPYFQKDPSRHAGTDLLSQIALSFHIHRGVGTVDNDGWIAFYYKFFLDSAGRLGAFVDGWAYQYGGSGGLADDGQDLTTVLDDIVPSFTPTIQSFLDPFCITADIFQDGEHDSNGRALFDNAYLLPGDGNTTLGPNDPYSNYPAPFSGTGARPSDVEATLALQPKLPPPPPPPPPGPVPTPQIQIAPAEGGKGSGLVIPSNLQHEREGEARLTTGSGLVDPPSPKREGEGEAGPRARSRRK